MSSVATTLNGLKVRFKHLTSQMYLSCGELLDPEDGAQHEAGAREYGTCLVTDGTGSNTLFFVHPVVQDTDFVPTDACVRYALHADVSSGCVLDDADGLHTCYWLAV
jgi:hypothetical protein